VARIKTVELVSLIPEKKERKLSARQIALMKRESEYEKAINKLVKGNALAFEPTEEKLPTLRASLHRVIARNERADQLQFAILGGIAYVALEPIPGARGARRKKLRLQT
jgi:hypothetical protein